MLRIAALLFFIPNYVVALRTRRQQREHALPPARQYRLVNW
jgi:hypothetical protein